MGLLTGKTALITGAARGIGKAVAIKFAKEGANIAFTDLVLNDDMKAGLEATRKEIEELGVTCRAYAGNAADFAETETVVKQIFADFGSIDILVNNAGITKDGLMLRMSEAQWDAVLNVNLKSAFNFIHACAPIMLRQKEYFNKLVKESKDEVAKLRKNKDTVKLLELQDSLERKSEEMLKENPAIKITPEQEKIYSTIGGMPHLDNNYTVFGEVVEGMDIVEAISKVRTDRRNRPVDDIIINKITIVQ